MVIVMLTFVDFTCLVYNIIIIFKMIGNETINPLGITKVVLQLTELIFDFEKKIV